jgi:hypothetical protein
MVFKAYVFVPLLHVIPDVICRNGITSLVQASSLDLAIAMNPYRTNLAAFCRLPVRVLAVQGLLSDDSVGNGVGVQRLVPRRRSPRP